MVSCIEFSSELESRTTDLKSFLDIAPHAKDFQEEQHPYWTKTTKISAQLLRPREVSPVNYIGLSTPQAFSTDGSLAKDIAYLRCQQLILASSGYGNNVQINYLLADSGELELLEKLTFFLGSITSSR